MNKVIRIGTRDSELALWQANTVKNALTKLGHEAELVPVKSQGDLNLDQPLYEMGITGIFTKTLDVAMLTGKVDIAVHSMKDVPTTLPKGIVEAAVLKRANTSDILLHKGLDFLDSEGTIATGSLRRKAQWLNRYPEHNVVDLRGNVNTRMKKLEESSWNGAIFAAAGLERINLKPDDHLELGWMLPAPAQGAMLVVAMEEDEQSLDALAALHHFNSAVCVHIEREFLKVLEGGCTAPIGALATIENETVKFNGALFSLDGSRKIEVTKEIPLKKIESFGKNCALEILENGGKELMREIRRVIN
ncbi:hydroxymethylbilane synthase [Antarcticibacterium flavum]|uniref:Hydroxymethylbilane synthase n=1 Tax=Antarcticibacterium flavum TaxID=2058175 RepID=A0A5B7X4W9_9FLAO|nr:MULTISPECIES: hydroxymethylbilane synthase [Antarcticibacterium]MCM4160599.1 hydroxymethylbilane synthase [Antarcticibacterium sp. W02-3]QCY69742.1 hydroxymethylbilane synthase [Antarcticibacterium flavum]